MGKKLQSIPIVMICTVMLACSSQPNKPVMSLDDRLKEMGYESREQVKSISNFYLDGWNYVNDKAIVLKSSPRRHYLITLLQTCYELDSAQTIGIDSDAGSVSRFNKLIVRVAPGIKRDCQIDNIYRLKKAEQE